ncbi:DUF7219 family protein [Roseofilum casamattae]|uniref:Uncharacterized protein n=1 Tax=Roseofilum casamattae BLCC-M143 TaxID=3022442 RepID=A0ABT7C1U5_9CYAN|nr:hypothetical protein [Roseofilum casamattae]MDJ1185401.1 hypothetical protein [Roseofilum casamattae BLCC-M143]
MINDSFLYPYHSYYGKLTPENLAFNANLQEFSEKINIISALENGGKISTVECYRRIQALWEDFEQATRKLGIEHSS